MSVITKLGLDLTEFSRGWNRAETIAATSAGAIGKAVHKKLGLQDAFKSFVAAIGIDVRSIADGIARFVTGVSKDEEEAFKQLGDLSDRVSEANIRNMRANLTEEQRYQLALRERDSLLKKISERQIKSTQDMVDSKKDELALSERIADIQQYQAEQAKKAAEESRKAVEARMDLNEKGHDERIGRLSAADRAKQLKGEISDIQDLLKGTALSGEGQEKWKQILEKRKGDLIRAEGDIDEEKSRRDEMKIKQGRAVRDVVESRDNLAAAVEDRGKLTLAELANIGAFQAGVSTDVSNQSNTARDVLELQRQAESARLGGRADDAIALLAQADKLKGGLSALTSGERADPFKAYKEALKKSEEELTAINNSLKGKYKSE